MRSIVTLALFLTLASGPDLRQAASDVYYSVPTWSPDGRTITFESNREGSAAVYTIRPDGSGLTRLTPAGTRGEQPNWSADGRQIIFTSSRAGVSQLFLMKPDGREVVAVPNTVNGFLAAFSRDGRWLLFAAQDTRPSTLYRVIVMRPDGSARRTLGSNSMSNEDPRWSIDGQRVVFTRVPVLERLPGERPREFVQRRTKAAELVSVALDGSDTRVIPPDMADTITRDRGLSPDGQWTVYSKALEGVTGLYLKELSSGNEQLLDRARRHP
jgi:Tol biopolymer transport system component